MGFWRDFWYGAPTAAPAVPVESSPAASLTTRDDSTPPAPPVQGAGVVPPSWASSAFVTSEQALGLEMVYRAVQVLATGVTQLSLDVERAGVVISAPLWIREPDIGVPIERFLDETVNSLALDGNAFWFVSRNDASAVTNLRLLPPLDVSVTIDYATGVRTYAYGGRDLKPGEIRHLGLLWIPGRARALGPIQAAREMLAGAVDLRDYASGWFHDAGVPTGTLTTDQPLNPDQAAAHKAQWNATQGGHRGTAILGQGLKYAPVLLSPKDAQFLESQNYATTGLARLFGIPLHLALVALQGSSMTYANTTQADLTFIRWTLSKYTREIEVAFSTLLPRGQRARFNLDALLRPDAISRGALHAQALAAGWMTVNEVRAIENLPPIAGGDKLKPAPAPFVPVPPAPVDPSADPGADPNATPDQGAAA